MTVLYGRRNLAFNTFVNRCFILQSAFLMFLSREEMLSLISSILLSTQFLWSHNLFLFRVDISRMREFKLSFLLWVVSKLSFSFLFSSAMGIAMLLIMCICGIPYWSLLFFLANIVISLSVLLKAFCRLS